MTLALAVFSARADNDNYFSIGKNGVVRVNPVYLNHTFHMPVSAHFEGRLDSWSLEFTYPIGIYINNVAPMSGMNVPYFKSNGAPDTCESILTVSLDKTVYSSTITEYGYWDYNLDGIYEPYGTVKWGPGDYNAMFEVKLNIPYDCTGDTITIDGQLSSTFDWRGGEVNEDFLMKFALVVGYDPGDVNGDSVLTLDDVTALINYLLTDEGLNAYQLVAADVNEDGYITIDDVGTLTNILLTQE